MHIRKGEKGVKLLRPEEIKFIVDEETGKWNYLNDKQIEELQAQKEQGLPVPDVQRMMLFYPFTVFNAAQIEGFPPKEQHAQNLPSGGAHFINIIAYFRFYLSNSYEDVLIIERNALVEDFIASSGVPVKHHNGDAFYETFYNFRDDTVKMCHFPIN